MPIRFRCEHCQTLMSIATRKAGQQVQCPACDLDVLVPLEDQVDIPEQRMPPAAANLAFPPVADPPSTPAVADPSLAPPAWTEPDGRVALPDDFFDFEPEESPPEPPLEPVADVDIQESNHFTAIEDSFKVASPPAADVQLPPLRSRSDEVPVAFTLPIRKQGIDDEMDLTPMVDVVFQLLIFFMVTASFALHKTIQTPSPDPDQKGATQSIQSLDDLEGVSILVRIDGQNGITIDDDPLPEDALVADALLTKMRTEQKNEIVITADAAAWHRTVVKVVDAANEVGMQKIRLATRSGPLD